MLLRSGAGVLLSSPIPSAPSWIMSEQDIGRPQPYHPPPPVGVHPPSSAYQAPSSSGTYTAHSDCNMLLILLRPVFLLHEKPCSSNF